MHRTSITQERGVQTMGWGKYDEDNRDYMEERWNAAGISAPMVFNYSSGKKSTQRMTGYSYSTRYYEKGCETRRAIQTDEERRK